MNPEGAGALALFLGLFLGAFVSEDATVVTAGLLIAAGKADPVLAIGGVLLGIFVSDLALVGAGRLAARGLRARWLRAVAPPEEAVAQASAWFARRGMWVVIASRFIPGTRAATCFAAGLLRAPLPKFIPVFLLAALIWTPLAVLVVARIGAEAIERFNAGAVSAAIALLAVLLVVGGALFSARRLLDPERRVLAWARIQRATRFEFWPFWAAYLPVFVCALWWIVRYRSLWVWRRCNPAIADDGFQGESKAGILRLLEGAGAPVPRWTTVGPDVDAGAVEAWAAGAWPVVVKPDVGQRGDGVRIARAAADVLATLRAASRPHVLQVFVGGAEYGILYERPRTGRPGRITSVHGKELPAVVGDGVRALRALILAHPRGPLLWGHFAAVHAAGLARVPAIGERIPLTEIGNHCKGAVFLDRRDLITPELLAAVEAFAGRMPGWRLGRLDVKAADDEALRAGRFVILELNGVASEPGHIYDPETGTVLGGWSALVRHWSLAWRFGAEAP